MLSYFYPARSTIKHESFSINFAIDLKLKNDLDIGYNIQIPNDFLI